MLLILANFRIMRETTATMLARHLLLLAERTNFRGSSAFWRGVLLYFILSALLLIILNLGTHNEGEPSTYSIFNPGCERLLIARTTNRRTF